MVRLTEKDDVTTLEGLRKAIKAVSIMPNTLLWASIPCTGGSKSWSINVNLPGGPEKLAEHRKKFGEIWASFKIVARQCHDRGGKIAIEWPSECSYWKENCVQKLVKELGLKRFRVNGCAMGLVGGPRKLPVSKPWDICTNEPTLQEVMGSYRCPGKQDHPEHCLTGGSINKETERYTDKMCQLIHRSWKIAVQCRDNEPENEDEWHTCLAAVSQPESELGWEDGTWDCPAMPVTDEVIYEHRQQDGHTLPGHEWPINACVARQLEKKEWRSSKEAMAALLKEYRALRDRGTWDVKSVTAKRELLRRKRLPGNEEMHIAGIFPIVVEKGSELPKGSEGRKFKGRIVFMGNNIRTQFGDIALFQDVASSPATLESSKVVIMHGLLQGNVIEQADAMQAYVQAKLEGEETWIAIPEEFWEQEWVKSGKYSKENPPCCKLEYALYGHPKSGKFWEDHAEKRIMDAGFKPINREAWRSMYYHEKLGCMLMVYVDDFLMSGPPKAMLEAWKGLRKDITMEDPAVINKCLGCNHIITERSIGELKVKVRGSAEESRDTISR